MPMASSSLSSDLADIKRELQAITPANFERMVAALVSNMIDVTVSVARSGFQHGGDGGTAGRQGRRLRIETKRYADTNPLKDRDLLGEFEQATQHDSELELWILAATREVHEQLADSLFESGSKQGVPVLIVDWKAEERLPVLAALCASAPAIVGTIAGGRAGICAGRIAPSADREIERIRRDLSAWHAGYEGPQAAASRRLSTLWNSRPDAVAALGQDAAGGAAEAFIERTGIIADLDTWRDGDVSVPALVVGEEGMGKTWATLGWLLGEANGGTIPLVIPSGAMPVRTRLTAADVMNLIGAGLHEVTDVRDRDFWSTRAGRMLLRPLEEGPVFTLFLDGMNQAPDAPWVPLLQQLQAEAFRGRIRVIMTTRPLFLERSLRNLGALIVRPERIQVGPYDLSSGGEFDRILAARGLDRSDIREDLVPLASVPRLFDLVVRLRDRLQGTERITVHTLLWEYGRDSIGAKAGRAFSESEWQQWLRSIAERLRETGNARFSAIDVEESVARPTLGPGDILSRLSDIVDGPLSDSDSSGRVTLRPDTVSHALGAAILSQFGESRRTAQEITADLDEWLGPISGLFERGEILRAAVAIFCTSPDTIPLEASGPIVSTWLATQNLPEHHRGEVFALAPAMATSLLYCVETMTGNAMRAPRDVAIDGLRSIPRDNSKIREQVVAATTRWMRKISRGVEEGIRGDENAERSRREHMLERVGSDADGPAMIFGIAVEFVPRADGEAFAKVPELLEGYPLAPFAELFELAALHLAIRARLDCWSSLKWLALLNEVDFDAAAAALEKRANDILVRPAETGVDPRLAARVAALLLWVSADPTVEARAQQIEPSLDSWRSYDRYEEDPANSMFMLERRHAAQVLADGALPPLARARRLQNFWWDPELAIGEAEAAEMIAAADRYAQNRLSGGLDQRHEDIDLEHLEPALARASPGTLAYLVRQRISALASMAERPPILGQLSYEALLVGDDETATTLHMVRKGLAGPNASEDDNVDRQLLLQPEIIDLESEAQVEAILDASLSILFTNIYPFLKPLDGEMSDRLVARHSSGTPAELARLAELLSVAANSLGPVAVAWLEERVRNADDEVKYPAMSALARCCPDAFGAKLAEAGWSWDDDNEHIAHHGSKALVEGTLNTPFELVAPRVAPWLLPWAARRRGGAPAEVCLAAEILDRIVRRSDIEPPETGSHITVDIVAREESPFIMSVTPGSHDDEDGLDGLRALLDQDERKAATDRAVQIAVERIRGARAKGASLYLANIDPQDIEPMLAHAATIVDGWLSGLDARSPEFCKRVRLAEGLFVALTEAMLEVDIEKGVNLWNGVKASLHTRFIGTAGVDKMILMLLRAPGHADIDDLVRDLIAPKLAHSDELLRDIAIAAAAGRREGLLARLAEEDRASGVRWRQERANVLDGLTTGEGASAIFPDGRDVSSQIMAARWGEHRYRDYCARHWWDAFWSAPTGEEAYAAWVLLASSADRRAIEWTVRNWPAAGANFPLLERKRAFAAGRWEELKRSADRRDKGLERKLFGRDIVHDIGPWTRRVRIDAATSILPD